MTAAIAQLGSGSATSSKNAAKRRGHALFGRLGLKCELPRTLRNARAQNEEGGALLEEEEEEEDAAEPEAPLGAKNAAERDGCPWWGWGCWGA